jgi:hypothetical protein
VHLAVFLLKNFLISTDTRKLNVTSKRHHANYHFRQKAPSQQVTLAAILRTRTRPLHRVRSLKEEIPNIRAAEPESILLSFPASTVVGDDFCSQSFPVPIPIPAARATVPKPVPVPALRRLPTRRPRLDPGLGFPTPCREPGGWPTGADGDGQSVRRGECLAQSV